LKIDKLGVQYQFVLLGTAAAFSQAPLVGSESFLAGLDVSINRLAHAEFVQMAARKLPYSYGFDVVVVLDVIEYIDEDETVLQNFFCPAKLGCGSIITTPQQK
jgi:hypothetical protein